MPHYKKRFVPRFNSSSRYNRQASNEYQFSGPSAPNSTKSGSLIYHNPLQSQPSPNTNHVTNKVIKIRALSSKGSTTTDTDSDEDDYLSKDQAYSQMLTEHYVQTSCSKIFRTTNSNNFAKYFPTSRLITIRHDTWSSDSNMNLRVETDDLNYHGAIQLFHLCIKDLDKRKFSLRRYERASGREVCKTIRRYVPATSVLSRSLSVAWANMKLSSAELNNSSLFFLPNRFRHSRMGHNVKSRPEKVFCTEDNSELVITNIIKLDFSNYAQVWVKRCVTKFSKRYNFEYWGHEYFWKRRVLKHRLKNKKVCYHLYRLDYILPIAQINPVDRSEREKIEQLQKGYWIPPYNLRIAQTTMDNIYCDLADVIVATGLIVLIDDTIENYQNQKF